MFNLEAAKFLGGIFGPVCVITGISVLFYAKDWIKVIQKWRKEPSQLLPIAMGELMLGLIVVNLYNVWTLNIWLIITLMGWGMVLESMYYLLGPSDLIVATLKLAESKKALYLCGILAILLGGILSYYSYAIFTCCGRF